MRIGMDVRKYSDLGIGSYISTLLTEFDVRLQHDLVLFASPEEAELIGSRHRGTVVVERARKYSMAEMFSLSAKARKMKCDVYHAPHYTLPLFLPSRNVVTVHDLIHLRFPDSFNAVKRAYARAMIGHACAAADAIITVSEFTKNDIVTMFQIDPGKIHVIPRGVGQGYSPFRIDLGRGEPESPVPEGTTYVLYVGSLKPHKNVPVLLQAFSQLGDIPDLRLVVSGEDFNANPGLVALADSLSIRDRIVNAGRVSTEGLIMLYQKAAVHVLPSLCEGFGLPILEAMACGTPVIGARAASIPEVIGEGGLMFDPADADELARLIRRVVTDKELSTSQRAYSLINVTRFSRADEATRTIEIYESVAAKGGA